MGNGMNRVLPGLYVGNYRDSKDASQLERHKITHIIAIHDAARRIHTDKEYLCIMASDSPYQNLSQYFPTCNDFIHSARIQGGNVLIHCLAGMSRSVTIAVAYIMSITSLRWNEALKVVRGARAVSNPNSGFQKQLQDFESTKLPEERRRMQEKFPASSFPGSDEEQCKKLLVSYNNMVLSRAICEGRCSSAKVCPTGTCRPHSSPRLGRQKSTESSIKAASSSSSAFSRAGSTKSLDSGTTQHDPESPKNWERHYGCWRNHFRHRQGTSSSPSTPILYRACKPQRTDSVTSISSMSSITSIPGQIINENVKDPCSSAISTSISASVLERNPFLTTQSCPNSPRRTPRKIQSTGGHACGEISKLVRIPSTSASAMDNLTTTSTTIAGTSSATTSKSIVTASTTTTGGSRVSEKVVCGSKANVIPKSRPSSAFAVLSKSTSSQVNKSSIFATSSGSATSASTSSNTSSPLASPWGTPPSSPANRSLATRKGTNTTGLKNVTSTTAGTTRWVMKRGAHNFTLESNSK